VLLGIFKWKRAKFKKYSGLKPNNVGWELLQYSNKFNRFTKEKKCVQAIILVKKKKTLATETCPVCLCPYYFYNWIE